MTLELNSSGSKLEEFIKFRIDILALTSAN